MEDDQLVERWRARGIAHAQAHTWSNRYDQLRNVVASWTHTL
jgi:hypothetical protein